MKIQLQDMQFVYRGLRYKSLCFEQRAKSYQMMVNVTQSYYCDILWAAVTRDN